VAAFTTDVPVNVLGLGAIEAQVIPRIGFEIPDTLVEMAADHGDRMATGAVLARINAASLSARVARAEARFACRSSATSRGARAGLR